jgi:hypothetical protein
MTNENTMTSTHSPWKSAMSSGGLLGIALIIFMLIIYLLDIPSTSSINWLSWIIFVGLLIYGQKAFRTENGGFISYGNLLKFGVMMGIFAGFLIGVWQYVLYTMIDTGLWERQMLELEETYLEMGLSEEMIEQSMKMNQKFSSPLFISLGSAFTYALMSLIISLITAAFLKKENESFESFVNTPENQD